jgi:hypothetical protein
MSIFPAYFLFGLFLRFSGLFEASKLNFFVMWGGENTKIYNKKKTKNIEGT